MIQIILFACLLLIAAFFLFVGITAAIVAFIKKRRGWSVEKSLKALKNQALRWG